MSIDQPKVIDARAIDEKTNEVCLFIFDHYDWCDPRSDHPFRLQDKINAYLSYIESGEIYENDPDYQGKPVIIKVIGKYPLSDFGIKFYEKATSIVQWAGFDLRFEQYQEKEDQK